MSNLLSIVQKLGFRPYNPDLDYPTALLAPEHGPLVFKSPEDFTDYVEKMNIRGYAYYAEMKTVAHPVRECRMPGLTYGSGSNFAKWCEWLACNDNYMYGTALMDPRLFTSLLKFSQDEARWKGTENFINIATYAKIPLEYHEVWWWHDYGSSDFKSVYGDAYTDIIKELMVSVFNGVCSDTSGTKTMREQFATRDKLYRLSGYASTIRKRVREAFVEIVSLMFKHRCRPAAARAIYNGQEGESPRALTVYGADTRLTRYLVSATAKSVPLMPLDPVWWWYNDEIRSKVDYRYAPNNGYCTPRSWGWLLRAGVPPVVLCEHKLTKAEASEFVKEKVPSWQYKLRPQGDLPENEPDYGMYFMNDKKDAITGEEIFKIRFKTKIESAYKIGAGTDWTIRNAIDTMLHRGSFMVREWALNKLDYLLKEHKIHGPRGREYTFRPISRVDEIRDEDLGGSTDAKPERVFERMGERIKKEIEAENLKGFAFPEWKHPLHPEIIYLSNSVALQTEGKTMHHCCGSYSKQCERGETFIFHVGPPAPFGSTVEAFYDDSFAGPNKLKIYQHYGPRNSTPDPEDKKIVLEWVEMCQKKRTKTKTNPPLRWRDVVLCPPMRG